MKLLSNLSESQSLLHFTTAMDRLKLGILVPVLVVGCFLASLVVLGDTISWITNLFPIPFATSWTTWDLLAEQKTSDDLTVVANAYAIQEGEDKVVHSYNLFYDVLPFYDRQLDRLEIKFPDRFKIANDRLDNDLHSAQVLYGGTCLLFLYFLCQLGIRKLKHSWRWLSHTTIPRTLGVMLILSILAIHYRLKWEWTVERNVSSRLQLTADLLKEESGYGSLNINEQIPNLLSKAKSARVLTDFWLARYFDHVSTSLWKTSYRQLR